MVIKNPNDIVDEFVSDYNSIFDKNLVSVIMYGSAVTHEYRPGISDINMAIVVKDNSISELSSCTHLYKKWIKKGVSAPFFMTPEYISTSLDTYPIEFLDMKSNYRVLYGEDLLRDVDIKKEHIRLQCERDLKGVALHLRKGYFQTGGTDKKLYELLRISIRSLVPVFKALIVLGDKQIPASKGDIFATVTDIYTPGNTVFSTIYLLKPKDLKGNYDDLFNEYGKNIDLLIDIIDKMQEKDG